MNINKIENERWKKKRKKREKWKNPGEFLLRCETRYGKFGILFF